MESQRKNRTEVTSVVIVEKSELQLWPRTINFEPLWPSALEYEQGGGGGRFFRCMKLLFIYLILVRLGGKMLGFRKSAAASFCILTCRHIDLSCILFFYYKVDQISCTVLV